MVRIGNEDNLARLLWISVAATFPSFAVSFLRVNLGNLHIPYPMLGMGGIFACALLYLLMHRGRAPKLAHLRGYETLAVLSSLFFLWHVGSLFLAEDQMREALKAVLKIGTSLGLFWGILLLFPRDRSFLERFWIVVLWSSVPLLSYLIYRSLSEGNPFLASLNVEDVTFKGGRNQVAWFVAMLVPFAWLYVWSTGRKARAAIPLLVIVFSLIYSTSRSAWLSVVTGLACVIFLLWKENRRQSAKMLVVGSAVLVLLVAGGTWIVSEYGNLREIEQKFLWVFNADEEFSGLHTYEARMSRVEYAWEGFKTSPLIGVGVSNAEYGASHNDYASILVELGLVGELLFLGILTSIGKRCWLRPRRDQPLGWTALASSGASIGLFISLTFINIYGSPHFWVFAGLFVVAADTERRIRGQARVAAARVTRHRGVPPAEPNLTRAN